jgi:hypothetical protein
MQIIYPFPHNARANAFYQPQPSYSIEPHTRDETSSPSQPLPAPYWEPVADAPRRYDMRPPYFQLGVRSLTFFAIVLLAAAQDPAPPSDPAQTDTGGKRILGIIPNYRSVPYAAVYVPISSKEKFKIAANDAFDRGTVALAAAFAGEGQLTNANQSFGQGAAGYSRYFATAYADLVIGDFMTEAIYPSLLHQDPRYFRRGTGSGMSRLGYSVGQLFRTRTDSGGRQFNYSEIVGNATAVAISNAYYQDQRDFSSAASKLGTQIGVDMVSNILKEFWPDLKRKMTRHPKPGPALPAPSSIPK